MHLFSGIFTALQAAIAARAARDRNLTVMLVALWGRIARMRTRLERLIAHWRAGTLPNARPSRAGVARASTNKLSFPTTPAWLVHKLGYEVAAFGSQLEHAISDSEIAAFLAAVPQAGRILRPLLHMLGVAEVPAVIRKVKPTGLAPSPAPVAKMAGVVVSPASQFLSA